MTCYTVGHSTRKLDKFIGIIKKYEIDCVMDVRNEDFCNENCTRDFHKEYLERSIKQEGINYIDMSCELGYKGDHMDFDDVLEDQLFKKGIHKIVEGIKRGHKIIIMSYEKDPFMCYRGILIGYALKKSGVSANHIIDVDNLINQDIIDENIFKFYEKGLRRSLVKSVLKDSLESKGYNDFTNDKLKDKIIEEGYRRQFKKLQDRKIVQKIRKTS